jgi:hypothetical protein
LQLTEHISAGQASTSRWRLLYRHLDHLPRHFHVSCICHGEKHRSSGGARHGIADSSPKPLLVRGWYARSGPVRRKASRTTDRDPTEPLVYKRTRPRARPWLRSSHSAPSALEKFCRSLRFPCRCKSWVLPFSFSLFSHSLPRGINCFEIATL